MKHSFKNKGSKAWLKLLSLALVSGLFLSACNAGGSGETTTVTTAPVTTTAATETESPASSSETTIEAPTDLSTEGSETQTETTEAAAAADLPVTDRAGYPLSLEAPANTVAVMAPAYAQIMEGLGVLDRIIVVDTNTPSAVAGLDEITQMDLFAPNIETLIDERPDLVLASSISLAGGSDNPFQQVVDAGIPVAYFPTADSLTDIAEDIRFIGDVLGLSEEGAALAADFEANLETLAEAAAAVETPKTALFEVAPAPEIYSFGSGVYLHEMLETIGAVNILSDQEGWLPVTEEAALAADPDVIFTSANWLPDPVRDVLDRAAWQGVTAVTNEEVYYIENNHTQLPSQKVADGMLEMAQAIYPEAFGDVTLR